MIAPDRVALVLLAAGRSSRFGDADKLAQSLDGLPVGLHLPHTVAHMPFRVRIAVTGPACPLDYAGHGFTLCINRDPAQGMGHSIALGVTAALEHDPDAILICLADMPRVTAAHLTALCAAFGPGDLFASVAGNLPDSPAMPPALFGPAHFAHLITLAGDSGARNLLRHATRIAAPAASLRDIDRPDDLVTLGK